MKKVLKTKSFFLIFLLLSSCQGHNSKSAQSAVSLVSDAQINFSYRQNCGMPQTNSFVVDGEILRFELFDGDIGKCSTDNLPFLGSSGYYKEYSERAEIVITSPRLQQNKVYEISFMYRVLRGYDNGDRNETFFQIKNCPDSRVPVMAFLRLDEPAVERFAFSLAAGTAAAQRVYGNDVINVRGYGWHHYVITYGVGNSDSEPSWLQLSIDGKEVLSRTFFDNVGSCNAYDTLRIGNYRSGADRRSNLTNSTSISEYKNITVLQLDY